MTGPVYRGFGPRQFPPGFFERAIMNMDGVRALGLGDFFDRYYAGAQEPFKGVTTDGRIRPDLYPIQETNISPAPMVAAARSLLDSLGIIEKANIRHRLGDVAQRLWSNAFLTFPPHGLLLEDLSDDARARVLEVLKASFSARGFDDVRTFMKFNAYLGDLVGDNGRNFTEWMYWFTLFNEPSETEPWGWQLVGHHIDIHCFIMGGQMVITPCFLGAEPNVSDATEGPYVGMKILQQEQLMGLSFMRGLDAKQRAQASLHHSMDAEGMPAYLQMGPDGRMRSVTAADNLVLPYEGVCAKDLNGAQRRQLIDLMDQYVGRMRDGHNKLKMEEVERNLEETHFAWVGDPDSDVMPFYYKIHSPVIMIEFDHHSGVVLDHDEPQRFHAHTMVRTPNGGDYGMDLLRQHYARFEHTPDGRHVVRPVGLSPPADEHARAHAEGRAHSHGPGHSHDHD